MGATFRFIADPSDPSEVINWFQSLVAAPAKVTNERSIVFYFKDFGQLIFGEDGKINSKLSPVVVISLPKIQRGILWTVGEVHFLSTPLRKQFPSLYKIKSDFSKWISTYECIYSNNQDTNKYDYYLEGSIRNYDSSVFAFDSGMNALRSQQYFVSEDDTESRLDTICKSLRLRGVQ